MTADLLQLDVSHHRTQKERERESRQLDATGHIGNSTFDISHTQLRFTRPASRGQGDHIHTYAHTHTAHLQHICTDTDSHQLTFAAKCCNGGLFML